MKAIMISTKPEYTANILNGYKTLELRTTCPKEWKDYLDGKTNVKPEPIKVYIYCTKGKKYLVIDSFENDDGYWEVYTTYQNLNDRNDRTTTPVNGKVIAEFTLKEINKIEICDPDMLVNGKIGNIMEYKKNTCLSLNDFMEYIGYGDDHDGWGPKEWSVGYAWHIDDLKIYDNPKELSEFYKWENCPHYYSSHEDGCCAENCPFYDKNFCNGHSLRVERPPQSWCYVEDLEEI